MKKLMQWFLFINQVGWALRVIFTLLKNMPVQMMAMKMLRDAGIVTIGICSSKVTGGTFCNVYGNDFLFSETKNKTENLLFAGKRVSASVNKGTELPENFGVSDSLIDKGMLCGL